MNAIKPLADDALLDAAEIADDVAVIDASLTQPRRDYLSMPEMQMLLDGANRVRVWREKRGVPLEALASAIGVPMSDLAEIETDLLPASTDLLRRVAGFLDLPLERLLPDTGSPSFLKKRSKKLLLDK